MCAGKGIDRQEIRGRWDKHMYPEFERGCLRAVGTRCPTLRVFALRLPRGSSGTVGFEERADRFACATLGSAYALVSQ